MADGDKLVRYITERVVTSLSTRRSTRAGSRVRRRKDREHWATRWFGMVPYAISQWYRKVKNRKRRKA